MLQKVEKKGNRTNMEEGEEKYDCLRDEETSWETMFVI